MSGGPAPRYGPLDFVRKALIVLTLIGAILLLHQFAALVGDFDPRGLLSLGFVVLAAYTIGELVGAVGIPPITGYLVAGIVFGPSAAHVLVDWYPALAYLPPLDEGVLSERVIGQLGIVDSLALAMIALTAGGELKAEDLRKSWVYVLGSTWAMVGVVMMVVTLYVLVVAPTALPAIGSLPFGARLATAVVLATLAAATSPAVSIAIVNSTGARGPVATTVLSGVVVGEITVVLVFSATSSIALGLLGSAGSVSVLEALTSVGLSIAIGAVVGGVISAYLRFVRAETLLFLLATMYATTFVIRQLHGEPAVAFIAAGLVVGNFSGRGETLIREVERLSRPVYVVFFALAGAQLRLDSLAMLFLPALGLFAVRMVGVWWGATSGARAAGAPPTVVSYAWTGFVSQAGLALALAAQARAVFPEREGEALFAMTLSVIAIGQLGGPLVLQTGLRLAGEIGAPDAPAEPSEAAPQGARGLRWERRASVEPSWGATVGTGSERLDQLVGRLEIDLRALLHQHALAPFEQARVDADAWLRELRRDTLRLFRRAATRTGSPAEVATQLRADVAELAEQWRDLAARRGSSSWSPFPMIDALDQAVNQLPPALEALIPEVVTAPRPEPRLLAVRRALLRFRARTFGGRRRVDIHGIGRYHLSGAAPARLESLTALRMRGELHLLDRTAALFEAIGAGFEAAARRAEGGETDLLHVDLARLRTAVDDQFALAGAEVEGIAADGASLAGQVLGGAFAQIRDDAVRIGTIDLPPGQRRFGRVFAERNRALERLATGTRAADELLDARRSQLGLELELMGIEARVRSVVRSRGAALARQLRVRGPHQLQVVSTAVTALLSRAAELVDSGVTAGAMVRGLRQEREAVGAKLREAHAAVSALVVELSDERWVSGLVHTLDELAQGLSESWTIPAGRRPDGDALPTTASRTPIALRDLVIAFMDSRVARNLVDLTTELGGRARELAACVDEVERVIAFNVELGCAELEVLDEAAVVPPETLQIVRATLQGAIPRSQGRLTRLQEVAELTADQTEQRVHDTVLRQLESVRTTILDGRAGELRATWLRDGRIGVLARRAEQLRGLAPAWGRRLADSGATAIGAERLAGMRAALGLEGPPVHDPRVAFAAPEPVEAVPVVYRRLFSELPLESGDLLAGRDEAIARLTGALLARGPVRATAVTGVDPQTATALVTTVVRSAFESVVRLDARPGTTADNVSEWLADATRELGQVLVVDQVHWLFERRPGGYAPLRRLVEGMLGDGGRNAWVFVADAAVWRSVSVATPLGAALGEPIALGPLSLGHLEQAISSRHAMSGYGVAFEAEPDLASRLRARLAGDADPAHRARGAWFRSLHSASGGVLSDALRLWMASIRSVDDDAERVTLGPVPAPPAPALAALPRDALLTAHEAVRQGWISPEQHARLFRAPVERSRAHLAHLEHQGLLVPDSGVLRVAPHLRAPLDQVFARRGWS